MPKITERLKLSLPLSNEYVQREVLVKAFEEIDRVIMLQGNLDSLKEIVNKYTDEAVKKIKDDTENKVGKQNGIAGLDKDGKVPTTQLPKREAKDVNLADAKGYYSEKTVESALQQVGADLVETDKKSQLLQQGLNVLNAPVASPLNIEIQGRTFVNLLGQTNLDNTKYYVFVPNKGTTKISYGGNTYEDVTKFTGQATVSYSVKQDFRGKVSGSVVDNGHSVKRTSFTTGASTVLLKPSEFSLEPTNSDYELLSTLDNKLLPVSNASNGAISQQLFSFDIIRTLQDKFGPQIWQGKTNLAEKIAIAKQVIMKLTCIWQGFGTSAGGNKVTIKRWLGDAVGWFSTTSHANGTVSKLTQLITNSEVSAGQGVDVKGFSHFLVHAEASNGTVSSVINTDCVELELEVNTSLPLLEDALYEIDQATYNKINVDPEYSGQKLLDKFPYVQGVQHLNPVVVAEGGNLIPPFTEWYQIHPNTTILSPYKVELSATGIYQACRVTFPVPPNTTFTVSRDDAEGYMYINFRDSKGVTVLSKSMEVGVKSLTFISPSTAVDILISWDNSSATSGKFTLTNPMMVLGTKPKPFTPRNPSYLYTNTVLAGQNGANDMLYQEDGQWKVLRKWERDIVLDGTTNWDSAVTDFNGYKMMKALKITSFKSLNAILLKGDATLLTYASASTMSNRFDFDSSGNLYISLSDMDTGFGETYTPIVDEVKAYFNGWKVKTADANGKPIAWKSVVDDKDAPTQILAYVKANRAPNYTPYKLTYQLATPRVEAVIVEGELAVNGMTQVSVDSGVMVREKVKIVNSGGYYRINDNALGSQLSYRVLNFLALYKNGHPVSIGSTNSGWYLDTTNPYGLYKLTCKQEFYDPTAEYTVTYLVQDKHQFTTNPIDVKATYNQSLKTSVAELVEKQADVATGLSILANATSENTKDIVALKKATADNTTEITDLKNKMNTNSTKLDKHLESLSRFRSNKDDNGIFRTLEWKTKSGVLRRKAVITMHPTTGDYDKQTVVEYGDDGTTITKIEEYKLILDGDGDIVNEVLQ